MSQYFFQLGVTTELCFAELQAVLHRLDYGEPVEFFSHLAMTETKKPLTDEQLQFLQNMLGGTVKIAEVIDISEKILDNTEIEKRAVEYLLSETVHRFSLAEFGRDQIETPDIIGIKKELHKAGKRMNYQETARTGASAAQLKHSTSELWIVQTDDKQYFGWTRTVQNIDEWSFRDVGKPVRERQRGMLQPKVARMMINVGLGDNVPQSEVVLDPFVGMGTILIEAADMGTPAVLGADIDQQAIYATTQNIEWWKKESEQTFAVELVRSEISHLSKTSFKHQPTVIVTEPFLGKLTPSAEHLPNVIRGLEKLYRGMTKAFSQLLIKDGKLVLILPRFEIEGKVHEMTSTLADLDRLGFILEQGPFTVGRPGAITQRQVYVLKYLPYGSR